VKFNKVDVERFCEEDFYGKIIHCNGELDYDVEITIRPRFFRNKKYAKNFVKLFNKHFQEFLDSFGE